MKREEIPQNKFERRTTLPCNVGRSPPPHAADCNSPKARAVLPPPANSLRCHTPAREAAPGQSYRKNPPIGPGKHRRPRRKTIEKETLTNDQPSSPSRRNEKSPSREMMM